MNELSSIGYSKPQFGGDNKNMMYIVIAIIVLALIGFLIYKYYFKTSKSSSQLPPLTILPSFKSFQLNVWGGTPNYSPPFQPVSTLRTTNALPLSISSPITTISISVNFGYTTSTTLTLSNYPAITPAILQQQGLFVQIDILPTSAVNSFYLTNSIPQSYFYNPVTYPGPMLFVSLIDQLNNVYIAGGANITVTNQQIASAINYTVTLNNDNTLTQTNPLSGGTPPYKAILVYQQ